MKSYPRIIFYFLAVIFFQNLYAQKTCSKDEDMIEDLNSISKCTIEKIDKPEQQKNSTLKVVYRKVRKRPTNLVLKKRGKTNSIESNNTIDNSFISKTKSEASLNIIKTQEVLFSIVDNIPLFPKCSSKDKVTNLNCFNKQMAKHFSKNFYPERASDDSNNKKAFIQFVIDYRGNVTNIDVKLFKKSASLQKEIERVIEKLPTFSPGTHKALPVNVKYSIPINLSSE